MRTKTAVHKHPISWRECTNLLLGIDVELGERRPVPGSNRFKQGVQSVVGGQRQCIADSAGPGHISKVCTQAGVAALHAGFTKVIVVQNDQGQVGWSGAEWIG